METTIRLGCFETNSSSVHALVLIPNDVLDAWEEDTSLWLDFGLLLDDAEKFGACSLDEPVIANESCFISDDEQWSRRTEKMRENDGIYIGDDEVVGEVELLPYEAVENPRAYSDHWINQFLSVSETSGGTLVTLDYSGWRDSK